MGIALAATSTTPKRTRNLQISQKYPQIRCLQMPLHSAKVDSPECARLRQCCAWHFTNATEYHRSAASSPCEECLQSSSQVCPNKSANEVKTDQSKMDFAQGEFLPVSCTRLARGIAISTVQWLPLTAM